ncbi:Golgi-associated plant pathogenesis protein 1 [Fasciola gigantica]|uniref:Golgi-associated plant pathogenesis protein 1 n=1 Tax=Fasciola gigantica TaxID=46835 RepID=A0A504YAW8_FASGI|nr:Golgi-associated plant pathogenesis protein 1 [Fasciola gigantica]
MSRNLQKQTFNQECLEAHNRLRALHGSKELTLDPRLSEEAQKWADNLAAKGSLEHSKCDGYGENLAFRGTSGSAEFTGAEAADQWYQEIKNHNFNENGFQPNSGHFSQLLWNDSSRCGFGKSYSPDRKNIYVVGRYQPQGNTDGEYSKNVLPQGKNQPPAGTNAPSARHAEDYRKKGDMPREEETRFRKTQKVIIVREYEDHR